MEGPEPSHLSGLSDTINNGDATFTIQAVLLEFHSVWSPKIFASVNHRNWNVHGVSFTNPDNNKNASIVILWKIEATHLIELHHSPCRSLKGFSSGTTSSQIAVLVVAATGAYKRSDSRTTASRNVIEFSVARDEGSSGSSENVEDKEFARTSWRNRVWMSGQRERAWSVQATAVLVNVCQ